MNKKILSQLPTDDQPVAKKIQLTAEDIQVPAAFQAKLESQLRERHKEKMVSTLSWQMKILPTLGWAVLIIGVVFLLNWVLSSLIPRQLPATNGTPDSSLPFEENISTGGICSGQLAVAHGFSIFLSNEDKSRLVELDEQENIDELRSFTWSPDGKQLVIVGNTRGSGNLYLMSSANNILQPVLSNSELGYLMGVAWSHGGSKLLTWEIRNNQRLVLINIDGTGLTKVDLPVQFFETPQFSPDNESYLFYGADASSAGLFQVSRDGSQVRLISDKVENEGSFAWSLDGSQLAYIETASSDLIQARLVVENYGDKAETVTYPIPAEIDLDTQKPANLSWAPDGQSLMFELRGSSIAVFVPANQEEDWIRIASAHAPAISADGRCLAFIRNKQVFLLDLTTASSTNMFPILLADLPAGRGSANTQLDKLQWGSETLLARDEQNSNKSTPTPTGTEYDWRGVKLYVNDAMPTAQTQVGLYEAQLDRHAKLDSARALALQFGMDGQIYEAPSEIGGDDRIGFLVVDGNQRLQVRSNLYFSYYPDYPRWLRNSTTGQKIDPSTAASLIEDFLRSHGFDLTYKLEYSELYNGYYALPLTPEGLTVRHNHFSSHGLLFIFENDDIISVGASLVDYSTVGTFGIITAEEALQKLLNPSAAGIVEGGHSPIKHIQAWYRPILENQTITVWGWLNSVKSAEGGMPFFTFDGYQATGNLAGMAENTPNTYVEVTGQFEDVEGAITFTVESWQVYNGHEEGLQGTIQREGDQVVLQTLDNLKFVLPDVPTDIPLPMENAFVRGIPHSGIFEWKAIDTRLHGGEGGGGGGGGSGFYKLNLTGTPVPLPTPQVIQEADSGTSEYIVQEGDTLIGIAETYGTTVDKLIQTNGLNETTIFVGQTLLIPGTQEETSLIGRTLDGLHGTLTVTITNKLDGGKSVDYRLQVEERESQYQLLKLEGDDLDDLQTRNNLPIDIWGTIVRYETDFSMKVPVVNVERFEIPYPDLQYQIFKGTQSITTDQGETITLFTTEDGQTYVQANGYGVLIGNEGDQILIEALVLPGETIAGYPVLQIVSASLAVNPKSGEPVEMEVTANQPYVIDEADYPELDLPEELTATIESVELVYFTPNQRYTIPNSTAGPVYIQPAWRFQGHYWDGSEFEILVQALRDEFLLPEIDSVGPPG